MRRCGDLREDKAGSAGQLSRRVGSLLRGAMVLRERRGRLGEERYHRACQRVEEGLDRVPVGEQEDEDNTRFVKPLRKHLEKLLTFLYVQGREPTNNEAERELRPTVVVRRISAGNRSERGRAYIPS